MEGIALKERVLIPVFDEEHLDSFFEEDIQAQVTKEHPSIYPNEPIPTKETETPNSNYLLFLRFLFLITGVFSTLVAQTMFYNGVADESSLITVTASYLGMALVVFIPTGPKIDVNSDMTPHRNQLVFLSLVDVIGNGLVTAGMFRIGSGLYQVISALLIPFIALLSRFVLNRTLNFLQWWGILAIFVGLTFNTFVSHITSTIQFEVDSNMIGILLTTSGIFLYAGCYVYTEKLLSKPNPPPPILVCQWTGIYGIIVCILFHLFYSLPSRYSKLSVLFSAAYSQTGTILEQEQASVSLSQGIGGFILLTLSALAHNSSYYILISSSGAVSTGIIQALRTVGVLVCSAFLYCGRDPHQCLSPAKFGSAFIVVLGVFIFSVFG